MSTLQARTLLTLVFAMAGFSAAQADSTQSPASDSDVGFSFSSGGGEHNESVARTIPDAFAFDPFSTSVDEISIGSTDPNKVGLNHAILTYVAPNFLHGSVNWGGVSTIHNYIDVNGVSQGQSDGTDDFVGFELAPLNGSFLISPDRSYAFYWPQATFQAQVFSLGVGPMVGYVNGEAPLAATVPGEAPNSSNPHIGIPVAGFGVQATGKLSSAMFFGPGPVRFESGASMSGLVAPITDNLGQLKNASLGTTGPINDSTLSGIAYIELAIRMNNSGAEVAADLEGIYDRTTPFDFDVGAAARNESTEIFFELSYRDGPGIGSPAEAGGAFGH